LGSGNVNTDLRTLFDGKTSRSIHTVSVSGDLRVLFLGAHPDDFDAVGITLEFFRKNGNPIEVGVVHTGSGVEDRYCDPPTLRKKTRIREQEQQMSCRFFGLSDAYLHFLDLEKDEEDQPIDVPVNRQILREFILAKHPDIVFLLHGNDTNSGHRRVYSMFRYIAPRIGYPLVAFLNRDPKTIDMRTDLYLPFGQKEAEWKARLLRIHDSQHQRNLNTRGHGFDERILNLNRQIAVELCLNQEYGEAFEIEFYNMPGRKSQQEDSPDCLQRAKGASRRG